MQYKTITLALLQEVPALYQQLRQNRLLLTAMETYALDLRERHQAWIPVIARKRPDSDSRQIASEALELAIEGLRSQLHGGSTPSEAAPSPAIARTSLHPQVMPPA